MSYENNITFDEYLIPFSGRELRYAYKHLIHTGQYVYQIIICLK
jgi:hypothetical protein